MAPEGTWPPRNQIDQFIVWITQKLGKIPDLVVPRRGLVLLSTLLIVAGLGAGAANLHMEQSFENFFAEGDTSTVDYRLFRNTFGSDESIVILYQPQNGDIFSPESLRQVKEFEEILNRERLDANSPLNRITRVRSIVSADYLETRGDTMINRKFIGENIPQGEVEVEKLKKLALAHRDYPGTFFSKDLKYGLITITTDLGTRLAVDANKPENKVEGQAADSEFDFGMDSEVQGDSGAGEFDFGAVEGESTGAMAEGSQPKYEELQPMDYSPIVRELRKILDEQGFAPVFHQYGVSYEPSQTSAQSYAMAGNPWIQEYVAIMMEYDLGLMMLASLLITFILLALSFRSMAAMVWPFVIIVLAEVATFGAIGWLGVSASMMITIVIFLILTLGVASSVHILSGYKIFYGEGAAHAEALSISYKKSGFSVILASLTTMAGLFALVVMPLVPVRNFGITAAIGILFALVLTLFLLPVLLSFWAPVRHQSHKEVKENPVEKWFQYFLASITRLVIEKPKALMAIFAVITLVGLSGYGRIKIDTSFSEMAKPGNGINETFNLIDDFFGGASTVELMIDTGETEGVRSLAVVEAMDQFTQRVLTERADFVPRAFSLVSAVKDSYRLLTDGSQKNYKLPENDRVLGQVLVMYDSADPESRRFMVDDDWRIGRISLSVYTKSSYEYQGFMSDLNTWMAEYFGPLKERYPDLKVTTTGGIPMMMRVVDFISYSQIRSFGLALTVVSIILFLIYGSVRFGILAIIPNLVPMTVIIGLAGWLDLSLDTDTLIVMPLAIGIVVDDTIHFLTHYRAELAHGATAQEAIKVSLKEVGQAMMFTSFILVAGFMIFLASTYIPFNKFGILSGGAIVSALLADLLLLPALLVTFYSESVARQESQEGKVMKNVKMVSVLLLFLVLAFFLASPAEAARNLKAPEKAKELILKMINREDGTSSYNETLLITCDYKEVEDKRTCTSKPRKKVFESISKDTGKDGKDTIGLSILIEPASEKNVAFLQKDYDDEEKETEQWMYLPAMKKLKRIVAEGENAPKTGTVFGSEFSYEDIEKLKVSDYDYSLVGESTFEGKKVWVIDTYPRKKRLAKTSYGRARHWVDQSNYIALKSELYDKQDHLKKTVFTRQIETYANVVVARQVIMVNHRSGRMSMMMIRKIVMNMKVDDGLYTVRALKEIGYREKLLNPIRQKAK